jgi:UPF0755 protein
MTIAWRFTRRHVLVAAGLAVVLVAAAYTAYRLELRAPATTGAAQSFHVKAGQSAPSVATGLKAAGLIRHRDVFITYLNLHGLRGRLQAGSYSIAPTLSAPQVADMLANGRTVADRLVVPEGYRISQIEALAADYGIAKSEFRAALAARSTGAGLEGYLFPDSYEVTPATTAAQLVEAMLANFNRRVGPAYVQAFSKQGLTLHQALTIASLVEREVNIAADRPIVAQIFLKRFRLGMPLGSDVTTEYASDLAGVPFNLDINSPYNTRKFAGLPPGPICNPGLNALDAVAQPAATDYLYFLSGKDGKTYFAKTLAQHEDNIVRHLR